MHKILSSRSLSLFLSPTVIPFVYGFSRIIVGLGCGGSIPIAYTRTSSGKESSRAVSRTSSILLLLQSGSWLLGPVLFHVALRLFGDSPLAIRRVLQYILRLRALYLSRVVTSSIPSLVSLILLIRSSNTIVYTPLDVDASRVSVPLPAPKPFSFVPCFLATGVTWLLYDFTVSAVRLSDA